MSPSGLRLIDDKNFIISKKMCRLYKKLRIERDFLYATNAEEEFPLAFSILVYNNVEQFERLLALIYRPQNVYCIHVDLKSSETVKQAIRSLADCFDNVFVTTRSERIIYAGFSRLQADINCLRDLTHLPELINNNENLIGKRRVNWK